MYRIRAVDLFQDDEALEAVLYFNRQTCAFPKIEQEALDHGWWWLAYHEKKPVGFCGLTKSTYRPNYCFFKRAGVDPKHRGNGLQSRFIQVRLRKARKLGFTHAVTDTTDTVYSANNLYKAGFKMFEPTVPWMEYKTSLYWIKAL